MDENANADHALSYAGEYETMRNGEFIIRAGYGGGRVDKYKDQNSIMAVRPCVHYGPARTGKTGIETEFRVIAAKYFRRPLPLPLPSPATR